MMDSNITVLSSAGITTTLRIGSNGVERTKMPFDSANLILENLFSVSRVAAQ